LNALEPIPGAVYFDGRLHLVRIGTEREYVAGRGARLVYAEGRNELRDALDHIARVAEQARTPTNRLAFIVHRARCALAGRPYDRRDVKIPPSAANETARAQRRAVALRQALEAILHRTECSSYGMGDDVARMAREALGEAVPS
jgi:hypothetical protein